MSAIPTEQARGVKVGEPHGLTGEPEQADVDFFNAAMGQAAQPSKALAQGMIGPLGAQLDAVNKLSEKANNALKHASGTLNPMDMINMNRSLSEYYLQSALTAKVVSKSAQSLDKLTNMQ